MSILRHITRLRYIDYLITRRATGNLNFFSKKNNLSPRGLLNVLDDMKELGFPIKYDRMAKSYFYSEPGGMVKHLFIGNVDVKDSREAMEGVADEELCFSPTQVFQKCE